MDLATVRNSSTAERVFAATASIVLERGARHLRTADIAERAQITESTLFRSVGKLADVLAGTDRWAWDRVISKISRAAFSQPQGRAREALLRDTEAIWAMRSDESDRIAAAFAFLFFRRKHEFDMEASPEQIQYTNRLKSLCSGVSNESELSLPDDSADLLSLLLLNYIATVWLTWETLPTDVNDPLGEHALSSDEAQLGVLVLLERAFRSAERH